MSTIATRMIVWIVLLTLTVQGLAALTTTLRGPAHYHSTSPTPAPQAGHSHASHHTERSHHAHDQVRRHYHLPGDGAIVVHDDRQHDDIAVESSNPKGESVSAAFVGLVSNSPQWHPPHLANVMDIGSAAKLRSCSLRRIERPPRFLSA